LIVSLSGLDFFHTLNCLASSIHRLSDECQGHGRGLPLPFRPTPSAWRRAETRNGPGFAVPHHPAQGRICL